MSQPFVGQIALVGFNFAPVGWAFCNGQLLPIIENETLFNLIGTTYGGDGQTTFALPDLRGRTPVGVGAGYVQGEVVGVEQVTLTQQQMPSHTHLVSANSAIFNSSVPSGSFFGSATTQPYGSGGSPTLLAPQSMTSDGGNQPHENRQPYLAVNWIISLFGLFPSQN